MKIVERKRSSSLFAIMGMLTVLVGGLIAQPVGATSQKSEVQYISSAEATVQNIVVTTDGNAIEVAFDYDLRGAATTATVDVAINDQQSLGPVEVTGPGHYDQTVTDLPDGSYAVYVVISGNPDYLLGESGPSNQPLILTLPSTATPTPNSSDFVKFTRNTYVTQHQFFK